MYNCIFKTLSNLIALCVIVVTLFLFIFQLVSVNATRDRKSDDIRRTEKACINLKNEIKALRADKERLCNAEILRRNQELPADMKEVPNEKIIRVRTMSVPCGTGRYAAPAPQELAIELNELAALSKR